VCGGGVFIFLVNGNAFAVARALRGGRRGRRREGGRAARKRRARVFGRRFWGGGGCVRACVRV
jgi:hypothetical protein